MRQKTLLSLILELTHRDIRGRFGTEFPTRIAFQKALYLMQASKSLIDPSYQFNLYIHGPYSPEWAKQGYTASSGGSDPVLLVKDDYSAIQRLIGDASMTWLVALATLHWYHEVAGLDRTGAKRKAEEEGKYSVLQHFDKAWNALERFNWLRST